jgi:hypothetical protein
MPKKAFGEVITKFLGLGGKEIAQQGGKEGAGAITRDVAGDVAGQVGQDVAGDVTGQAVSKGIGKTVAEGTTKGIANTLSFTTKEIAVPLVKAVGPTAAFVILGYAVLDRLGEAGEQLRNDLINLFCDEEDDSEDCEKLAGAAVGIGAILLVAGGLGLTIVLTRRR